jgi:hypothetical protein
LRLCLRYCSVHKRRPSLVKYVNEGGVIKVRY